ncbi:MAG: hypothetical protein V3S70_07805, partial [Gammaproteobacteria bacterium]
PTRGPTSPEEISARALICRYLAVAEEGQASAGVDSAEIKEMMDVIGARLESDEMATACAGTTGQCATGQRGSGSHARVVHRSVLHRKTRRQRE